jgi:hypothetical protein
LKRGETRGGVRRVHNPQQAFKVGGVDSFENQRVRVVTALKHLVII